MMPLKFLHIFYVCMMLLCYDVAFSQKPAKGVFPERPADSWELGLHAGYAYIRGDVDSRPGWGGGLFIRKSLGHVFSLRADYTGSFNYGLDYRNRVHQGSIDVVAAFNTGGHYHEAGRISPYLFAGYGIMMADVDMGEGYHINAPVHNGNRDGIGLYHNNQLIRHIIEAGAGISIRVDKKYTLGVEQKFTGAFSDDMDGVYAGKANDVFSYTSLRGGVFLGNMQRRSIPLWWINSNDYVYAELGSPRHMIQPVPVLPDADNDGVTDMFDREPDTPAGVAVDTHGVAVDSDGDGVPDDKDEEKLTRQMCFPVNSRGVGNCPEPACCRALWECGFVCMPYIRPCVRMVLPSVVFASSETKLNSVRIDSLLEITNKLNEHFTCSLLLTVYGKSEKKAGRLSKSRIAGIITWLTEKEGISEARLQVLYTTGVSANEVRFSTF